MYHYTDGGLRNIWLENGYERTETPYGMVITIQDLLGIQKSLKLIHRRTKSVSKPDIKN